ncbi:hypothetical protein UY3_10988 [Chelonia mydas]|uniref:Uncharacterized protein n=1 Tax=Chelonia mydas TaxID=8469 RepID=M7B8P2_CHEMY|nr:hypothetical protein UY3_10988 [Chelonia mydas]
MLIKVASPVQCDVTHTVRMRSRRQRQAHVIPGKRWNIRYSGNGGINFSTSCLHMGTSTLTNTHRWQRLTQSSAVVEELEVQGVVGSFQSFLQPGEKSGSGSDVAPDAVQGKRKSHPPQPSWD